MMDPNQHARQQSFAVTESPTIGARGFTGLQLTADLQFRYLFVRRRK